jgi:hypothetical protein
MPDGVIAAVEEMALRENQPLIPGGVLTFEWHNFRKARH